MGRREIFAKLNVELAKLDFGSPVTHVYNPLLYARKTHELYWERFGTGGGKVIMLGMNPGPWGMAQTGVPFGEISLVRDWMGIEGAVDKPEREHPKRPVTGFSCKRSEVSGRRLWGWARERFGASKQFFDRFFVINYCPLMFIEESGRNRTPVQLRKAESAPLFEACDAALAELIALMQPELIVGVGVFAEERARKVLGSTGVRIGRITHPSPANPKANRGWAEVVEREFGELGIQIG